MTGQGLYAQWMAANAEANNICDGWEFMDEFDHAVWESFARRVARAYPTVDIGLSASLTEDIINNLLNAQIVFGSGGGNSHWIDQAMTKVRALRSLLLLKETQRENAIYRGCNEVPR